MDLHAIGSAILKVGSLSGLASFGWQLRKAWLETRDRLTVRTTRVGDAGLTAFVSYRPPTHHAGLKVRVTAVRPAEARVAALLRSEKEALRDSIERAVQQLGAERTTEARLLRLASDPEGLFRAEVYVTGIDPDAPTAEIEVEVWSTAHPRRLIRDRLKISAID